MEHFDRMWFTKVIYVSLHQLQKRKEERNVEGSLAPNQNVENIILCLVIFMRNDIKKNNKKNEHIQSKTGICGRIETKNPLPYKKTT